jgi:hypothetical protein
LFDECVEEPQLIANTTSKLVLVFHTHHPLWGTSIPFIFVLVVKDWGFLCIGLSFGQWLVCETISVVGFICIYLVQVQSHQFRMFLGKCWIISLIVCAFLL